MAVGAGGGRRGGGGRRSAWRRGSSAGATRAAVSARRPIRPPRSGRRTVIGRVLPWVGWSSGRSIRSGARSPAEVRPAIRERQARVRRSPNRNRRLATLRGAVVGILHGVPGDGDGSVAHTCQVVPMKVGVAKETAPGERRVALVPEALGKLHGGRARDPRRARRRRRRGHPRQRLHGRRRDGRLDRRAVRPVRRRPPRPEAVGRRGQACCARARRVVGLLAAADRPADGEGARRRRASPRSASTRSRGR